MYQDVIHRRLKLASQYSREIRYQPAGTLRVVPNRRLHPRALAVEKPTSLQVRDSALEAMIGDWNRLPAYLVQLSSWNLGRKLKQINYQDVRAEVYIAMHASVLLL